jgi:porin
LLHGRYTGFAVALITIAVLHIFTASGVQADFPGSQAGNAAPQESSSQGQQIENSGFEDKATGDWWGQRQRLKQAGVSIDATLVLEGFKNFRGGLRTTTLVGDSTFDLSLGLDTEKLFNWKGGKFNITLEDHAGRNPSQVLVGDLQIFDKLNSAAYLQFFELWYQQKLFDDKLRFKIGKVDANTEFSVIDNGLPFINSSTQVSPTVFIFPTTPDPMPSVNVFFTPCAFYYASFGAYYSNRSDRFGNLVGSPQTAQVSNFGSFLIGETGLQWQNAPILKNGGNLKLGVWGHTDTFPRFDDTQQRGTYGYYAIFDQTLWKPEGGLRNGRGVRMFLVYGRTQQSITPIYQHFGGGVTWTGPLAARPEDIVGFSPQYAQLSPQAGLPFPYELAMETFYKLKVTAWAALQPDLQYIIHPGGQYANALVGTIRMEVNF